MMPIGSLLLIWGFLAVVSTAPTQIGSDLSTDQDPPCTSSRTGICWKKKCPFGQAYFDQRALACVCPDAPDKMVCKAHSYFEGELTNISPDRRGAILHIHWCRGLLQEEMSLWSGVL